MLVAPFLVVTAVTGLALPLTAALRIKSRLRFEPGVMVISVPWQLTSIDAKDLDRYDRDLARGPARGRRYRGGGHGPDGSRPDTSEPEQ